MCGVRCKIRAEILATDMSLIEGLERSSPEYLKALEEELAQARVAHKTLEDELDDLKSDKASAGIVKMDPDSPILRAITDRLASLELSIKKSGDPVTTGTPAPPLRYIHVPTTVPPAPTTTVSPTSGITPSHTLSVTTSGTTMTTHVSPSPSGTGTAVTPHVVPAHALGGPLTTALHRIGSTDPGIGREYDPSVYVLLTKNAADAKNFDRSKMDLNDLLYGWTKMATMIVNNAGDIRAYISHLAFAAEMFHSRKFSVKGLVDYDAYIVSRVLSGAMPGFGPDPIGASLHFSPNVIQELPQNITGYAQRQGRGRKNYRRRGQGNSSEEKVEIPSDFPADICYLYNYRSCPGNCGRNHICRVCRAKHEARTCNVKKI